MKGNKPPKCKTGFYELLDFQQNGINTDYTTENGQLGIFYGPINQGKLSDYHRLDASVRKTIDLPKQQQLRIVGSLTNVYNRENVFYFDRVRYERVNQLPLLPSIALNYSF